MTTVVSRGMSVAAVSVLLLATVAAAVQDAAVADEDLMKASPLTVAQCRAGCLHKVRRVFLHDYSSFISSQCICEHRVIVILPFARKSEIFRESSETRVSRENPLQPLRFVEMSNCFLTDSWFFSTMSDHYSLTVKFSSGYFRCLFLTNRDDKRRNVVFLFEKLISLSELFSLFSTLLGGPLV